MILKGRNGGCYSVVAPGEGPVGIVDAIGSFTTICPVETVDSTGLVGKAEPFELDAFVGRFFPSNSVEFTVSTNEVGGDAADPPFKAIYGIKYEFQNSEKGFCREEAVVVSLIFV
jgi:hypothetical protein